MKNFTLILIICCLLVNPSLFSQVGIGTNAPDSSAILDLESTQRGFLPPRMTTEQRDSIQNPAIGLIIYNLDCHCVNFFNGDQWMEYGRDPVESFNCGQVLTDTRTGRSYNTIMIGSQCWMAENLDVGEMISNTDSSADNGIIEKYCYGNAPGNCSKFGALYRWDELMQYDTNRYNQGICAEGWHLPNADEWDTLVNFYGGQNTAGAALKEEGISGFEALLAGGMKHDNSFYGKGSRGYFWSPASTGSSTGWAYNLNDGNDAFNKLDTVKQNAYPVRCIKGYPNRADTGVVVIDTNVYAIISDSAELAQGIYKYTFGQRKRDDIIVANNIIIGITGEGYIRKVDSMSENRNQMTLLTSQTTMEDVFVSGEFNASVPLGDTNLNERGVWLRGRILYLAKGMTINQTRDGFVFGMQDVTLFQDDNVTVIGNGNMQFDPDFKFDFKFRENNVRKLGFYAIDAPLINTIDLTLSVNSAIETNEEVVLASYEKYFLFWVWGWPVTGVVRLDLKAKNNLSFSAPVEASVGYTNSNSISFGVLYENGTWSKIWDFQKTNTLHPLTVDVGEFDIEQKFEIVPEASVRFYGVAGPYFNTSAYEKMNFAYALPSHDWNSDIKVGLTSNLGAEVTIFGVTLAQYNKELFGYELNLWEAPSSIEIISGNNQTGVIGQQLLDPIIVKVEDSRGETFANIPVHFAVTSGGGSLEDTDVMTDASGYAQTNWTLGPSGNQVSASVLKANGENISGSPKIFTANTSTSGSSYCGGTITAFHLAGNVAPVNKTVTYSTVSGLPGETPKCWITSNLGADHQATSKDDATEESAGWYWQFNRMQGYKHDGTIRTPNTSWTLINENSDWVAINDPCNLELGNGWRIPTSTEWINVDAIGNWTDWNGPWNSELKIHAAGHLWCASSGLAFRGSDGRYSSSSQSNNNYSWLLNFGTGFSSVTTISDCGSKSDGFSVRCIRD